MIEPRRLLKAATSFPVRLAVSVGLLAIVAASIDWDAVSTGLRMASWGFVAGAVAIFFVAFVLAALRWRALLESAWVHVSHFEALRAYFMGMFSNNLLPTGYGGDAVRAWVVGTTGKPLARSLISVVVDRISALACLLVVAWISAAVIAEEIPGGLVMLLGIATGLSAAAGIVGLVIARRRGLGRFLPDAIRPWTAEIANVIRAYEHDRRLIAEVAGLGLIYQALILTGFWFIAEALGLDLNPAELAVVVPPVLLAALLPISVAGFGVREGAFVVLLGEFGISSADATLLSLFSVAAVAVASAPGGLAIAIGKRERASSISSSSEPGTPASTRAPR